MHLHHEHTRTFSISAVDSAIRDTFKLIRIYLDESVRAEYKENPEIESKGAVMP